MAQVSISDSIGVDDPFTQLMNNARIFPHRFEPTHCLFAGPSSRSLSDMDIGVQHGVRAG